MLRVEGLVCLSETCVKMNCRWYTFGLDKGGTRAEGEDGQGAAIASSSVANTWRPPLLDRVRLSPPPSVGTPLRRARRRFLKQRLRENSREKNIIAKWFVMQHAIESLKLTFFRVSLVLKVTILACVFGVCRPSAIIRMLRSGYCYWTALIECVRVNEDIASPLKFTQSENIRRFLVS